MSNFGRYFGKEFLSLPLLKREWLVENIMRKNDSVILVGNEKSGKSLFVFQLICALTSGQPFFDKYNVPKPCRVTYIQLEGELSDSQDRMKRMIKVLDINPDLFQLIFYPPLELQEVGYTQTIAEIIEQDWNPGIDIRKAKALKQEIIKPDIIIIDPLYFAYAGSLSDDEAVRKFIGNLRILKDRINCAIMLVHHTHKQRFDYTGGKVDEGDEALFGSKMFKAWADHIPLFTFDKQTGLRTFACNTQRSGDIEKECVLKLNEPDPLYFEPVHKTLDNKEEKLVNLLSNEEYVNGLSIKEIATLLGVCDKTIYNSIKEPLVKGIILKSDSRPVKYRYNSNKEIV